MPEAAKLDPAAAAAAKVPLLILVAPSSAASMEALWLREQLNEADFTSVSTTINSADLDAEGLRELVSQHAGLIICLSDALAHWLAKVGHAADVGARGFTLSSFLGWLARGARSQKQRHALRVFPVVLQRNEPSARRAECLELVGGRCTLDILRLGSREPLENLLQSLRCRLLKEHYSMRLPSRYLFVCVPPSFHRQPDQQKLVARLKSSLRALLSIHALESRDMRMCGDLPGTAAKQASRAFASLVCLSDAALIGPSSDEQANQWEELDTIREAGALLIPVVLGSQRLRKPSLVRWQQLLPAKSTFTNSFFMGGRLERLQEQMARRVPEPLLLSSPEAYERLRTELDAAAALSRRCTDPSPNAMLPAVSQPHPTLLGARSRVPSGIHSRSLSHIGMRDASAEPTRAMRHAVSEGSLALAARVRSNNGRHQGSLLPFISRDRLL